MKFLAIVGPTAAGKTELSIRVARRLGGEIVGMDSRQVYRGMDVGTAKATPEERAAVPHHGLDRIDPGSRFSAAEWAAMARETIVAIRERGRVPVLVGGTGFYLKALMEPLFDEPDIDEDRRHRTERYLEALPIDVLGRWVERLDPDRSEIARAGGRQRLVRTISVALLTGRPLSEWHGRDPAVEGIEGVVVALEADVGDLDRRIEARVDRMLSGGLIEEVDRLLSEGWDETAPGMTAVGYRELLRVRAGEWPLDRARDEIVRATRRYARRQRTWFRHQLPEEALRLDVSLTVREMSDRIVEEWRSRSGESARPDPEHPSGDSVERFSE